MLASWHVLAPDNRALLILYNSVFYDNEPYFARSLHFQSDIESAGATLYSLSILVIILKGFMDACQCCLRKSLSHIRHALLKRNRLLDMHI